MSRPVVLLLLSFCATITFAQTEAETIQKAKSLVEEKKYESAFKVLDMYDPANSKPDVVLLKQDILLNYFVTSIMHQMFSLKDIEKHENILDYRGQEGSSGMYVFEADSILTALIGQYPDNCKLVKGLGEYYFEAHLKYGENWLLDDAELKRRMETNFQKAIDQQCADYLSYYVLGYLNIVQERYREGIPFFQKAIERNDKDATTYYNLAFTYLNLNELPNAIPPAKKALELYDDRSFKGDAARMLGQIYLELDDLKNAQSYFEQANEIDPGNYYTLRSLLNLYLRIGHPQAPETAAAFFNLDPSNLGIYSELEELYYNLNKENELAPVLEQQLALFKTDDAIQGNLSFFLGKIYLSSDKTRAKQYFLNARDFFGKVFEKDHEVFSVLEEGIRQSEN